MRKFRPPSRAARATVLCLLGVLALGVAAMAADRAGSSSPDRRPGESKRYDVLNPDFRGTFGGDSKALIAIRAKNGRRVKGLFQAKNKELTCEDGTRQVKTLDALIIHFRGRRYFDGQSYSLSDTGFESYRSVRGRISKDGQTARGKFLVIANSPHPEEDPGCNTYGWVGWHAEREPLDSGQPAPATDEKRN